MVASLHFKNKLQLPKRFDACTMDLYDSVCKMQLPIQINNLLVFHKGATQTKYNFFYSKDMFCSAPGACPEANDASFTEKLINLS